MRKILKKFFPVIAVSFIFLPEAQSQDFPKYEFHGGYSYTAMGGRNWFGWQVSASRNFNHYVGISFNFFALDSSKTEFLFYQVFKTDKRRYYFLAGPKFADRSWKKWIPYAHFLIGASKTTTSYQYDLDEQTRITGVDKDNTFAMMIGGGFNYRINGQLLIHMVQGNFIRNLVNNEWDVWEDGGMVSFGLEYSWK
jgi:hypothetical protein